MPYLRSLTARALAQHGLRQDRIAEHLGVSQAMVSKYLRDPARPTHHLAADRVERLVDVAVQSTLKHERIGQVGPHCPVCRSLADDGLFCAMDRAAAVEQCVRSDRPVARSEQEAVLETLSRAESWIRRAEFRALQPAVRINLAMALTKAHDARDVAAFPGRLVELHGHVRAVSSPEFGSSSHLAQLLVSVRRRRPDLRAVMNVRGDERVRTAARRAGLAIRSLKRTGGELALSAPLRGDFDGFVDPGAFGVEPSLYLLASEPNRVVEKAVRILTHLKAKTARTRK